jgi:putative DNA primase/helicase
MSRPRVHPSVLKRFAGAGDEPDKTVEAALVKNQFGAPKPSLLNATNILDADPRWAGRLRYDLHAEITRQDGEPVQDHLESECAIWLDRVYGVTIGSKTAGEAMATVSRRHSYHPVREYLSGLVWDGVPRVGRWVATYLGCAQGRLAEHLGSLWMVQAVARAFQPGCQAKTMLILAGQQDAGKSKALAALCGQEWFSRTRLDLHSKDAFQALEGTWIQEIQELDGFRGGDANRVKAFVSGEVDKFRPAYGRNMRRHKRDCVFAGTTNERVFLEDPTGSCRFWPIQVASSIDAEAIARDRDQLWAEAVRLYRDGVEWWLDKRAADALRAHNEQYQDDPSWMELVAAALEGEETVTAAQVFERIGVPVTQQSKSRQRELADVLSRLGWVPCRVRVAGQKLRGYRAPQ